MLLGGVFLLFGLLLVGLFLDRQLGLVLRARSLLTLRHPNLPLSCSILRGPFGSRFRSSPTQRAARSPPPRPARAAGSPRTRLRGSGCSRVHPDGSRPRTRSCARGAPRAR